jgi:repressor of nif and glnA expression
MGKAIKADKTGKKILEIIDNVQPIWPAELLQVLLNFGYTCTQPALAYRLRRYKEAGWLTKRKQRGGKIVFLKITEKGRGQLSCAVTS